MQNPSKRANFTKFYFFKKKDGKSSKTRLKIAKFFSSKNRKSAVAGDKCHNWMKIHEKMTKFQ